MPYDYAKMSANQAEKYLSDVEAVTLDNADQVFAALAAMKEKNDLVFMSYLNDLGVVDQKDHFEVA
jgi:phosphoribulokinase